MTGHCFRSAQFAGYFAGGLLALLLAPVTSRADDGVLPPAALKAVKHATTYLRVTLPECNLRQGSGFFAVEPGLLLTNAHVLGMKRPGSKPPRKVEVVVHSGEPQEKTYSAEVLGVDRGGDLALLRVTGKDLPASLKVLAAAGLQETQTVFVFGFPYGKDLSKNITVSKTSVSNLRKNANGSLFRIQVNGGMHPGNSGGPVVNGKGQAIGIAVAGFQQDAQINFAVPGKVILPLFHGRISKLDTGEPYREQGADKVAMTIEFLDPLKRIKKVSLKYWTGRPGKPRLATQGEPKPLPGDSRWQELVLEYRQGKATGVLTLPALPQGDVYWMQPVYVNGTGQTRWVMATVYTPGPSPQRKP